MSWGCALRAGKKFDLRIYVLVTSYTPLVVWLYRSGFGRFTFSRYSSDTTTMDNLYVHLTNVAIQKTSSEYRQGQGCKWSIKALKLFMVRACVRGGRVRCACIAPVPIAAGAGVAWQASKHGMRAAEALFADIQVCLRCSSACV
jgi:hypothetical protein